MTSPLMTSPLLDICLQKGTRHNSADSVPTSNLVCIKEVAIRTTLCIAGLIYYICNLVINIQCTHYKNAFNKRFERIVSQNKSAKIYTDKIITVCNAVYFRLCIDLMHILPPVTAEGFDGSHHPRFAERTKRMATGIVFQRLKNSSSISRYIFDRHIFKNFVATVIRETNILVIFNVFMKYSALICLQNTMFNDEIYNNGGRPYFDFW